MIMTNLVLSSMDSDFELLEGVTPLTIDDLVFSPNYARFQPSYDLKIIRYSDEDDNDEVDDDDDTQRGGGRGEL